MRIDIITVLPELLKSPFEASILKRAIEANLVEVHFHNLRDYTTDNYKSIDDTQFGGGAGMVMMVEPIDKCISKLKEARNYDEVHQRNIYRRLCAFWRRIRCSSIM